MKKGRREVLSDCHKSAFLSFLSDAVPGEEDAWCFILCWIRTARDSRDASSLFRRSAMPKTPFQVLFLLLSSCLPLTVFFDSYPPERDNMRLFLFLTLRIRLVFAFLPIKLYSDRSRFFLKSRKLSCGYRVKKLSLSWS